MSMPDWPRLPGGATGRSSHSGRVMQAAVLPPAARTDALLRAETSVWLSTVTPDGTPHLVPIWFSWDGHRLFIASKPGAKKVRNLRQNPRLMLAIGEPDEDFDVALVEAEAVLPDATTRDLLPAGHLAKYRRRMRAIGLTDEEYVETYSQPILVTPTRFLPWHGRTTPPSAVPAVGLGGALRGMAARLRGSLGSRRAIPAFAGA
jgi:PPOX class probable F420-dependent enzyme